MPFQRVWDHGEEVYVVDRSFTGPPRPAPETGTVVAEDGTVVAQSATIAITPATPVKVNLPHPGEPIVMADGKINHHWWRFFNELYLRTGGVVDNINRVPTTLLGTGSHDALAFTGYAPSPEITHIRQMGKGSVAITGYAPSVEITHIRQMSVGSASITGYIAQPALSSPVEAPLVGSVAITGQALTIDNTS